MSESTREVVPGGRRDHHGSQAPRLWETDATGRRVARSTQRGESAAEWRP